MKTSIFDMTFVLPPMLEMTEVEKEMPTNTGAADSACTYRGCNSNCQETDMKTSIFDMNFVLPPVVEMIEVMQDNPISTDATGPC